MDISTTPDEIKRLNIFETLLSKQYIQVYNLH